MGFLHFLVKPFVATAAAATLAMGGGAALHNTNFEAHAGAQAHAVGVMHDQDQDGDRDHGRAHATSTPSSSLAIEAEGAVHLVGATVTSLASSSLSAAASWGSTTLPFTIDLSGAKLVGHGHASSSLSSVKVGDTVNVSGSLNASASQPTVEAKLLRDLSL